MILHTPLLFWFEKPVYSKKKSDGLISKREPEPDGFACDG
jgi:hypothetical protein